MPVLSEDSYVIIDPFFVPGSWQRCGSGGKDGKGILTLLRNSTASTGATLPSTTGMDFCEASPSRAEVLWAWHSDTVHGDVELFLQTKLHGLVLDELRNVTRQGFLLLFILLPCSAVLREPVQRMAREPVADEVVGEALSRRIARITVATCCNPCTVHWHWFSEGPSAEWTSGSSLALGANAKASMQVAFPFCGFPSTLGRLGLLPRLLGTWRCGCTATVVLELGRESETVGI